MTRQESRLVAFPAIASSPVADPTQLPAAAGQTKPVFTYGAGLTSGQKYIDPVANLTVLKVTDANTPIANTRAHHDYSEGAPFISQPWLNGGVTYYTLMVAAEPNRYLVDVRYSDMTLSNWRQIDLVADLCFAFSLNTATPRIAFVQLNTLPNVVQRFDTATGLVANIGLWPWSPAVGNINWLQTQLTDRWLVAMGSNTTVVAFRPSDGLTRSWAPALLDEPHLDREKAFAYIVLANPVALADLDNGGALTYPPGDPAWTYLPGSLREGAHINPLRGGAVGAANSANLAYWKYNVLTNTTAAFATSDEVDGYPGEFHQAGQWCMNGNGDGAGFQWFIIDPSGSDFPSAAIRTGMIAFVRTSGTPKARLLCSHNSTGGSADYTVQPHTTLAPDGKFVMWTSDNMSGRTDVYIVKVPVI